MQQSLAIHHPYALATFRSLAGETLLTSNPASSPRFLTTSAPPTAVSPRSRRKSHKQNCSVIRCACDARQSCCPTSV